MGSPSTDFAALPAQARANIQAQQLAAQGQFNAAFGGGGLGQLGIPMPGQAIRRSREGDERERMAIKESVRSAAMHHLTESELLSMVLEKQQPAQQKIRGERLADKEYTDVDVERIKLRVVK